MKNRLSDELDLFEIFGVLAAYKRFILIATALLTLAGAAGVMLLEPKYKSTATFLVRQRESANPLEPWGNLAEQFGYRVKSSSDPLLSNLSRVLETDGFYAGFLEQSLKPGDPDSSLQRVLRVDSLPEGKKIEAMAGKIISFLEFEMNDDKTNTITVQSPDPRLSLYLTNGIIERLNGFFEERERSEQVRKLQFLKTELATNRRELDSVSNRLAQFLQANKDFSSPGLAHQYQKLKRDETIYTEKYLVTMKAYQTMSIAASQPEYFFEVVQLGKLPEVPSFPKRAPLSVAAFAASLFLSCAMVILFRWLVLLRTGRPAA